VLAIYYGAVTAEIRNSNIACNISYPEYETYFDDTGNIYATKMVLD